MFSNLLYVLATSNLLVGSVLSFNKEELPDYFYLIGTTLFFLKSGICLINDFKRPKSSYTEIL